MAARRAEGIQSSSLRSDRIIRKRLVCHCSVFIQRRGSHFDIRAMLDVSSACGGTPGTRSPISPVGRREDRRDQ